MSSLTRMFSRRSNCLESDESNMKDPELGLSQIAHDAATSPRVGNPYRLTCRVDPAEDDRHEYQDPPHGLPSNYTEHSSPRPLVLHGELSSPSLTVDTRIARMSIRTSYADSEFSKFEVPVSPDRYDFALNNIIRNSPTTPTHTHLRESDHIEATRRDEVSKSNRLYSQVDRGPVVPIVEDDDLEAYMDSTSGSSSDRSITRYSGLFVNNNGYRQMSAEEIEAELQSSMHSLRIATTAEQRKFISGSGTDDSHLDSTQKVYQSLAEQQRLQIRTLSQAAMALDPGSSQTSSSRDGVMKSNKASSLLSQLRSPTPPLLYGRNTMTSSSIREVENVGQSRAFGSVAEDWETISDMRSNLQTYNGTADTQTGSSLADNSDPGDVSVLESSLPGPRRLGPSQYRGLPRPHQAYILMRDLHSGSTTNVPLHEVQEDRRYQHPIPICENHVNPFLSSPPAIQINKGSAGFDDLGTMAAQHLERQPSVRSNSTDFDKLVETYGSINDAHNHHDVGKVEEMATEKDKQESALKEPSPESSTWLSAVSESAAGESPHPTRNGSFAMVTILNSKGNLTGTPEGTGAREVGSSLAGASSPPDQPLSSSTADLDMHSSPAGPKSPWTPRGSEDAPFADPEDAFSVVSGVHTPTPQPRFAPLAICGVSTSSSTNIQPPNHQKMPDQATGMSGTPVLYSFASSDAEPPSSLASRARAFLMGSSSKQRRRRSSSEGDRKAKAPTSSIKVSALPSSGAGGHRKRNSMTVLMANPSPSDDAMIEKCTHQGKMREHQVDQAHIGSHQASQSTTSASSGSVLRPPIILDATYSPRALPDHPHRNGGRIQACMEKIHHPMSRHNSPHLIHVSCAPTAEMLKRQEQISKLWLPIFCIIPPCALAFGYGYADSIIQYQTGGEIQRFTGWSRMCAKVWGLLATPAIIVVTVMCALFVSG